MNTSTVSNVNPAELKDWRAYYRMTQGRETARLAIEACRMLDFPGNALDLGCGACIEVRHFLNEGIARVDGVDHCSSCLEFASSIHQEFGPHRFRFHQALFGEFEFKENAYDLVFSDGSLPWHGQEGIEELIGRAKSSLRESGVFVASFMGDRHWARKKYPEVAFLSKSELLRLFADLKVTVDEDAISEPLGTRHLLTVKAKKTDSHI